MSDCWWDVGPSAISNQPQCAARCQVPPAGPREPAPTPAQLLITAAPPFNIVNVTDAWCRLTDFSAEAVFGQPVELLHGPLTCAETLAALTNAMSLGRPLRVMLVSYTANGAAALLSLFQPCPRRRRRCDCTHTHARSSVRPGLWTQRPDTCRGVGLRSVGLRRSAEHACHTRVPLLCPPHLALPSLPLPPQAVPFSTALTPGRC
jgi:hypothetical protein